MARASDEPKARSPLEEARATLYAAPLEEFVELRGRLAADLRGRGDNELASARATVDTARSAMTALE